MGLAQSHISPTKESERIMKKQQVTIRCIGKKQPSQTAIDNFIKTYKEMVKSNQEKRKNNE